MNEPTPAEVIRKAREHNISTVEARRVIAATDRIDAVKASKRILHPDDLRLPEPTGMQWDEHDERL